MKPRPKQAGPAAQLRPASQTPAGARPGQDHNENGRRIALEGKGKKGPDQGPAGFPAAEQAPRFEPVPPAKTVRAPKRPLTYQDFPELHQGGGAGADVPAESKSGQAERLFRLDGR